jgi:hypothetical protein
MFFMSVALKQIQVLQLEIINSIKQGTMTLSWYYKSRAKVRSLHDATHEVMEKLALAAFVNKLTWLFVVWLYAREAHIYTDFTAADMFLADLLLGPYLLKEIGFFFYIVLKAALQNTLQAELVTTAVIKHNELCESKGDDDVTLEELKQRDIFKTIYMDSVRYANLYFISSSN